MSALTDYEKNELSLGRRYRQYEHAYNAAFAADPNPQSRQFNETAPKDDVQWKRLETFRGNDKQAYHAHQSNPGDPLAKPTEKEQSAWQANQADHWRVEREPAFGQHDATNNKWLALTPEARNSDKGQAFLAHVDQKHGASYNAYAAKSGNNAVDRNDYLRTMAVVEVEGMRAAQQQQSQAPAQQSSAPTQASQSPAPAQPSEDQAPKKSRLNFADFSRPANQQIDDRAADISKMSDKELEQTKAQAKQQHEAQGLGKLEGQHEKVESYNRVQSALQAARAARRQESLAEAQSRNRSQSQ